MHSVLAVRGAALQQRKFVIRTHLLLLEAGEGLRPIAPYVTHHDLRLNASMILKSVLANAYFSNSLILTHLKVLHLQGLRLPRHEFTLKGVQCNLEVRVGVIDRGDRLARL